MLAKYSGAQSASAFSQRKRVQHLQTPCLNQHIHSQAARRLVCRAGNDLPPAFSTASPATPPSIPEPSVLQQQTPAAPQAINTLKRADTVKGCRTVLGELRGLDFSKGEVLLYFRASTKAPKGFEPSELPQAIAALQMLSQLDEDGDPLPAAFFQDMRGLALTQAMLSELWRWRRAGGGMAQDDGKDRPHQSALAEIQNFQQEDIDRVQSTLLDSLPISDAQKEEMSGSVQQVAAGAFQGAVWGSLVAGLLFVILFNFARG